MRRPGMHEFVFVTAATLAACSGSQDARPPDVSIEPVPAVFALEDGDPQVGALEIYRQEGTAQIDGKSWPVVTETQHNRDLEEPDRLFVYLGSTGGEGLLPCAVTTPAADSAGGRYPAIIAAPDGTDSLFPEGRFIDADSPAYIYPLQSSSDPAEEDIAFVNRVAGTEQFDELKGKDVIKAGLKASPNTTFRLLGNSVEVIAHWSVPDAKAGASVADVQKVVRETKPVVEALEDFCKDN